MSMANGGKTTTNAQVQNLQIGHTNTKPDYQSTSRMQQQLLNRKGNLSASQQQTREQIDMHKKDLRSSHFLLGNNRNSGESSS